MPNVQTKTLQIAAIQQIDVYLFQKFNLLCHQRIKQLAVAVSKTGDGYLYAIIAGYLYFTDVTNADAFFYITLAAFALELPLYLALKNTLKRARPFNSISDFNSHISPSDKFSMPSGHTAAAFVFATMISAFFPTWAVLAYSWASLIGVSRIVLGVHFPGDIIAGALLGYGCAELALSSFG